MVSIGREGPRMVRLHRRLMSEEVGPGVMSEEVGPGMVSEEVGPGMVRFDRIVWDRRSAPRG
jgi:hypothetical protein